jgi:hypothetical protein
MATSFSGGRSQCPERTTNHGQATGKLDHLVIDLYDYELLGNPTTYLIETPGPKIEYLN